VWERPFKTLTRWAFKELGLHSQKVEKLALKLHVIFMLLDLSLQIALIRLVPLTVTNSHQDPFSDEACDHPDPIQSSFLILGEGVFFEASKCMKYHIGAPFQAI
jgi:hypothetical protein